MLICFMVRVYFKSQKSLTAVLYSHLFVHKQLLTLEKDELLFIHSAKRTKATWSYEMNTPQPHTYYLSYTYIYIYKYIAPIILYYNLNCSFNENIKVYDSLNF